MRKIVIAAALIGAFMVAGCSMNGYKGGNWELPDNAVNLACKEDKDQGTMIYECNGRSYSPYGTSAGRIGSDTIRDCLGYTGNDKNTRVYSLSSDPYDNYLMVLNVNGIMEQPVFIRAIDTKNESVFTPDCIKPLGYEEWGSSGAYDKIRTADVGITLNAPDIREIGYEYSVNGRNGGGGSVCNADGSVINKGELFNIGVSETDIKGKAGLDEPFDVSMAFTVTDKDGNVHKVEGTLEHEMMLGSSLMNFEIRTDTNGGYVLFEDK